MNFTNLKTLRDLRVKLDIINILLFDIGKYSPEQDCRFVGTGYRCYDTDFLRNYFVIPFHNRGGLMEDFFYFILENSIVRIYKHEFRMIIYLIFLSWHGLDDQGNNSLDPPYIFA